MKKKNACKAEESCTNTKNGAPLELRLGRRHVANALHVGADAALGARRRVGPLEELALEPLHELHNELGENGAEGGKREEERVFK